MTGAELAALWALSGEGIARGATVRPPSLPQSAFDEAARGGVGRLSLPGKGAAGVALIEAARPWVWLAITDDRMSESVANLEEVALAGAWSSPKTLYQRIDLPWPFSDRHWVMKSVNNYPLAAATGVWERAWSVDNSLLASARERTSAEDFDLAESVPDNRGSWLLLEVGPTATLALYQAWSDLGGGIPKEAAEAFLRASLNDLMVGMERSAQAMPGRYGPGCARQLGGDGVAIPCAGG